ncbi:hypothetical protein FXO37_02314 [Capsicum annuum]|nr:hypothetical protein FXO37_02314 [Capsicum annuum]
MQRISLIKATLLLLYSDGTQWIFQLNELTEQKKPPMQLLNLKDLAEATIEVERNNNAIKSFNKGYSSYTSSRWNKNKDFNKSIEKKLLDKAIPRYPPNNESNHYSNTNSRGTMALGYDIQPSTNGESLDTLVKKAFEKNAIEKSAPRYPPRGRGNPNLKGTQWFHCQGWGHRMSECPTQRDIILWEGDPYYKDEVEQEEGHIEGVDNLDENAEVQVDPCDGDITAPSMIEPPKIRDLEHDEFLNLSTNSLQEGENDASQTTPKTQDQGHWKSFRDEEK